MKLGCFYSDWLEGNLEISLNVIHSFKSDILIGFIILICGVTNVAFHD